MFDRIIAWSLRNRPLVLALTLALLLAGGETLRRMPLDVFPEFAPPQVVVQTEAPGMAPRDVETLITTPLENAINGAPGVAALRSRTAVGLSSITVVFEPDSNIDLDRQRIAERLQAARARLPAAAQPPAMLPVTSAVGWLLKYALTSDTVSPQQLRALSDWTIAPRLLALGGIASVVSLGGEVRQYQVRLDPDRLQAWGLSVDAVRQALERTNAGTAGGFVHAGATELVVRADARPGSLDDVRAVPVAWRGGRPVTVGDVAEVVVGSAVRTGDAAFGARPAVIGTVSKAWGADTLRTTARVEAALNEIARTLPPDVHLDTQVFRQASFIDAAVYNLTEALLQGALVVVVVLFVFLMNWRASLITFVSMPLSFVGGLLVMRAFGVGINAMTLGGLAIAIGEVVDNGIVTVENVVRRLRLERAAAAPRPAAAVVLDATREVANSVVFATLIIALIFLPIFFLGGLAGRIFAPLGVAYIASVAASLVVAVTVVPALCVLLLPASLGQRGAHAPPADPHAGHTALVRALQRALAAVLARTLARPALVLAPAVLALAGALALLPRFGLSFLPEFKEGNFIIAMTTLPGTSLDESMRLGGLVRASLMKYPQVVSIDQRAGRSELDDDAQGANFSEFDVRLDYARDPRMPAAELLRRIRADLDTVPGTAFNVGQFVAHRMDEVQSGVRAQVVVKIFGPRLDTLYGLGLRARQLVGTVPGVVDVNLEQQIDVPQITVRADPARAARVGVAAADLARDVGVALDGETVSSILDTGHPVDLVLRMAPRMKDADAIGELPVDAPQAGASGVRVALRQVADVALESQPYAISRENAQRVIALGFNVQGRDLGAVVDAVRARLGRELTLPPGYFVEYGGQFESRRDAQRTLLGFGALALLGALVLLHKAFGRLGDALLVLCNLPLGMIGGVAALYLAGADLSVAALIGFVTLFGISTRNGIILLTRFQQLRDSGMPLREQVMRGTLDRLAPVLMTAATAALGLLPLLFGDPVGKELEVPLAQVVLGGLITATLLNMVVVPTAYYRLELRRARHETAAHHDNHDKE